MVIADKEVGSYYAQIPRASHFSIEVIDLDSLASPSTAAHPSILGPAVKSAILQAEMTLPHLGWYEDDSSTLRQFRLTPDGQGLDPYQYGVNAVNNQNVWGVMIVNANATSGVWSAITSGTNWDRESAKLAQANKSSEWSNNVHLRGSTKLLRDRPICLPTCNGTRHFRHLLRRHDPRLASPSSGKRFGGIGCSSGGELDRSIQL